jgi:NAD(P)-dependent dehydrogenase (short-subunit alcohol dehydrogenase family)
MPSADCNCSIALSLAPFLFRCISLYERPERAGSLEAELDKILQDKVAIVTGAGRGIGRAIAHLMAKEGARVVVVDIGAALDGSGGDAGPAQTVVNEIKTASGEALASTLSITDPANAEKIVASAVEVFGRVDILVNNAGILRDRMFHKMSVADFTDVIAVHLMGSFNMSRACATHFRERQTGAMVHMTSTSALVGSYGQANYMAAKFGMVGLSRGIAMDMSRFNVRSNCVAPFAWSRMIESIPADSEMQKAEIERTKPLTPEKIAPLVVYLASDLAKNVSGQIFGVRRNEVYLFNQPRPVATLKEPKGFTPSGIAEQMKTEAAKLTPLEGTAEFFDWDPV